MQTTSKDSTTLASRIVGWGADLNPKNRPGVPKEKAPPHGTGAHWDFPERQRVNHKIFKTKYRRDLTPVFGTSCPPKGLSGLLRDFAYRISEEKAARWMTLLLADRMDVVESILIDVMHGKAGNPFSQTGVGVEFKERGQFARPQRRKLALFAFLGVTGVLLKNAVQENLKRKQKPSILNPDQEAA